MPKAMVYCPGDSDAVREIVQEAGGRAMVDYGNSLMVRVSISGMEALREAGFRLREMTRVRREWGGESELLGAEGMDLGGRVEESAEAGELDESWHYESWHYVVQLIGPLHDLWTEELTRLGVVLYECLEDYDYLCGCPTEALETVRGLAFVEAAERYPVRFKISADGLGEAFGLPMDSERGLLSTSTDPSLEDDLALESESAREDGIDRAVDDSAAMGNLELRLFESGDVPALWERLEARGLTVIDTIEKSLIVSAQAQDIPWLLTLREIWEIYPHGEATTHNNVARDIVAVDSLAESHGLDGEGEVVAVADTGLDRGQNDATLSADFRGRVVSIHALGRSGDASDLTNHGTHVTGTLLGNGGHSNGKIRGMAPAARLVFQSIGDADRGLGGLPKDLAEGLFDVALEEGAHLHNNSWGIAGSHGGYHLRALQADRFAFEHRDFLIVCSAGNQGPKRVTAPGTAKNVLTVGASRSVRPLPETVAFPSRSDGLTRDLREVADTADRVADFSCRGPVQGRRKPDVVAPGTFILSARSAVSTADRGGDGLPDTDDEDSVFTRAESVSLGLPGGPLFGGGDHPAPEAPAGSGAEAKERYCYESGTSMAAAMVTGVCALIRQFLRQRMGHEPSAALLKALVINGARTLTGVAEAVQGWGRVDLERTLFFTGQGSVHFDDELEHAVSVSDLRTYRFSPHTLGEPIVATLVWRDFARSSLQNRLHLSLVDPSGRRHALVQSAFRVKDTVQRVEVAAAESGVYTVEVDCDSIFRGVPELSGRRQDFALVVANCEGLVLDF